jgi:outer membrane protein assembly factor BamE (lipoprotein component of BamABCDE complex)
MHHRSLMRVLIGVVVGPLALFGCASTQSLDDGASRLTVGLVQGSIEIGIDAASVAEILGSPNIVTTDDKRREVWVYDKISTERMDNVRSSGASIFILGASSETRQSSSRQRTLTIIIKFDEDKRVRDFAYNYTQF